uniref:uncharacterized protein LOC103793810 n=1 Tax=Callithrix jacchus TaxID=9483 RepID=UPI0008400ACA|nr:uncharacterized protein LOC103793810 [Callithrix jacchus]
MFPLPKGAELPPLAPDETELGVEGVRRSRPELGLAGRADAAVWRERMRGEVTRSGQRESSCPKQGTSWSGARASQGRCVGARALSGRRVPSPADAPAPPACFSARRPRAPRLRCARPDPSEGGRPEPQGGRKKRGSKPQTRDP